MDIPLVGRSENQHIRFSRDAELQLTKMQLLVTCCRWGGRLTGAVGVISGITSLILAATSPDMSPESRTAAYAGGSVAVFVGFCCACCCGRTELTVTQNSNFNQHFGV